MFGIYLLSTSLGLFCLTYLGLWMERAAGKKVFSETRAGFDNAIAAFFNSAVLGGVPNEWRDQFVKSTHDVIHLMVQVGVSVLRALERPLSRLSYRMRMRQPQATATEVSEFLKTITPERRGGDLVEKSV